MKKFVLIVVGCMIFGFANSQQTVSCDSLWYYEGDVITVCNKVTGTFVTKGAEKTTFLNFGNFPNQLFTVVIYQEHLKNFSYSPAEFLNGKNICVIGDVIMRDSGPEIIVESPDQIRVTD
jgi:hypothetical protein